MLHAGAEGHADKQWACFEKAVVADDAHLEVYLAWACAQQLRAAYRHRNVAEGGKIAERILTSFPTCPIPEINRRTDLEAVAHSLPGLL